MKKKIVFTLECLLFTLFAAALCTISFEEATDNLWYLSLTAWSLTFITVVLSVVSYLRRPNRSLPTGWISALSLTALFALISSRAPQEEAGSALAALVMVVAGLTGKTFAFIIPLICLTFGETARSLVLILLEEAQITPETLISDLALPHPLRFLTLLLSGTLPALISRIYRLERYTQQRPAVLPEQTLPADNRPDASNDGTAQSASSPREHNFVSGQPLDERDVSELLSSVVYFMSRNFRSYSALGFIFNSSKQAFVLNSFTSKSINIVRGAVIPAGNGVIGTMAIEKRPFISGDLRVYNEVLPYYSSGREQINSILVVPIISESSELLGALVLDSHDKQAFRDQDRETLKRFSFLAAALITTARMRLFQERAARTFQTFYEASHQFTTALKPEDVFDVLFTVTPTIVPCTRLMGIMFNDDQHAGTVICTNRTGSDPAPGFTFPINAGICSFAFQKRRSVNIADYRQISDRYYRFVPGEPVDPALRSLIILPLVDDEQRCRGLFSIENDKPDTFIPTIEQVLKTLAENASVALIRSVLYQRMEHLATTDGLTGLNNHRHFQELLAQEIERSRRYRRPLALLIMDIDHFKSFNDTYGHPVGDLVLKEIATCIKNAIRLNDIPARYGGEEFVVIIPESTAQGALKTAERIRTSIEQHTIVSLGRNLKVTISIGCSSFPENAPSQQALIDTADKALYNAKEHGRNRVMFYQTAK